MDIKDFDRDKFISEDWSKALESGEFKQTNGQLFNDGKYCCLGVACELLSKMGLVDRNLWIYDYSLPQEVSKILDLNPEGAFIENSEKFDLASLNDDGFSFSQIASKIREIHKNGLFLEVGDW